MTTLNRVMFAGLWLAGLAAAILILRSGGGPLVALALAPLMGAALASSFDPSHR